MNTLYINTHSISQHIDCKRRFKASHTQHNVSQYTGCAKKVTLVLGKIRYLWNCCKFFFSKLTVLTEKVSDHIFCNIFLHSKIIPIWTYMCIFQSEQIIKLRFWLKNGGTAAAAPPPFRPGNPALCGSYPLVTPCYCRLADLLCFVFIVSLLYFFC